MRNQRRDVERVWSDTPEDEAAEDVPEVAEHAGPVRVRLSTSGRRGKAVTVIEGLPASQRKAIAKELRRACGTGGAVKDPDVEIQGDHREKIVGLLGDRFSVRGG